MKTERGNDDIIGASSSTELTLDNQQPIKDVHFRIAAAVLKMLDSERAEWEFRTFDDDAGRKNPKLTRVIRGSLKGSFTALARMNQVGAGVFVTINRTDGKGRKAANVTSVQAIFADTDGADLAPLLKLPPHVVVESSPGKFHCYWKVNNCQLSEFSAIQKAIAKRYGTDAKVCDLPRVMRLPGFQHLKHDPFRVMPVARAMNPRLPPYTIDEVIDGLELTIPITSSKARSKKIRGSEQSDLRNAAEPRTFLPPPASEMREMLEFLATRGVFKDRNGVSTDGDGHIIKIGWIEVGMALKAAYG